MNSYEAKQAARKERLENAAEKARNESNTLSDRAHLMAAQIPLGQPILIGHHSEGRDRNYRKKISRTFDRAHEAHKEARELASRAASVGTGGISSDDPDAIEKLRGELVEINAKIALWKKFNDAHKAFLKYPVSLDTSDLLEGTKEMIRNFKPEFASEPHPVERFKFANARANARRIEKRIADLLTKARAPAREVIRGVLDGAEFYIKEDRDENRVIIVFDAIPSEERRARLKYYGFKWSPTRGAWVRMLNNAAWYAAGEAVK